MRSGLLWVTHAKDLEWFEVSARSYKKYATGWEWAKCLVPDTDVEAFKPACEAAEIILCGFEQWPDKGFNHHQAMKCMGDINFPEAEAIFHIDSDCAFISYCTPADWFVGDRILLPYTDFEHFLYNPLKPEEAVSFMGVEGRKIDFSRGQYYWKFAADWALGWSVARETMAWTPIVHHPETYAKTRAIIAERFPELGFEGYVRTCANEFPQSFAEFNTLGAVAHRYLEDKYHWHDCHALGIPFSGKVVQSWSHGGFDKSHKYCKEAGGRQIPRMMFQRHGLL